MKHKGFTTNTSPDNHTRAPWRRPPLDIHISTMARLSSRNGAAKPFTAWTTIFYLLLVFIAPLAFFGTAHAEEDSVQDNYGTVIGIDLGTTYSYVLQL